MEHMERERILARMAELQPRVPDWCKAERMEYSVPQKELWYLGENMKKSLWNRLKHQIHRQRK